MKAAIDSYYLFRPLTDMWGLQPLVPFAVNYSGCRLGLPTVETDAVHIMYLDTPPGPHVSSLEALMRDTAAGLRGNNEEWRPHITDQFLTWINREAEADDFDQ